ncbi:MAG: alkaline phosphatase D family protein [Solirubrobacterales bacterium]
MGRSPRQLIGAAAAIVVATAVLAPASALASNGFTSGVTAGEVTDHAAIVWARTNHPAFVVAQVATDPGFHHVVQQRSMRASAANDSTVQTQFRGLVSNTSYHYRFCYPAGQPCSAAGKFLTAPQPTDSKTIRFAYSGDETAVSAPGQQKPYYGGFKAFGSMANEHNDFNIDFGDTIYSDPEVPGAATASGVGEKWAIYRKKLGIPNMQTIRSTTGLYNHWDDHEFINDFSIPEDGRALYDRSVRAFQNYEPVTFSNQNGIYRSFRWGKNLQLFFLDERSFRSAKASANHVCDNPDTGQPDLAPTAPQSTRNVFAAIIPSLAQPVSQACKDKINSPNRTFLGNPQLQRFLHDVKGSTAKWKVVMNEDPIQQFYALPYDRWEGYAYERVKLLKALQKANVKHLAFLTTDTHAAFQNVVNYRTLSGDVAPANAASMATPSPSPYQDFIIGPVGTKNFFGEIDDTTGQPGSGQLISQAFFKPVLHMGCAQGGVNSYAEVTVKSGSLKVAYKDENGNTVKDVDGTTPCGPYVLTH